MRKRVSISIWQPAVSPKGALSPRPPTPAGAGSLGLGSRELPGAPGPRDRPRAAGAQPSRGRRQHRAAAPAPNAPAGRVARGGRSRAPGAAPEARAEPSSLQGAPRGALKLTAGAPSWPAGSSLRAREKPVRVPCRSHRDSGSHGARWPRSPGTDPPRGRRSLQRPAELAGPRRTTVSSVPRGGGRGPGAPAANWGVCGPAGERQVEPGCGRGPAGS